MTAPHKDRILMVIAPEQFRDEELLVPRAHFLEQGWTVDVAGVRAGEATGMLGAREMISLTLEQVQPETYAAILVVGGMGSPEYLWDNVQLHKLLKTAFSENHVIGAICLSGAVLAKAGLLHGKKATVWESPEALAALKAGGAEYTGAPVTVSGRIVTANGPEAARAFADAVLTVLKEAVPVL